MYNTRDPPLPFLEDTDELRRDMVMFYGVVTRMDEAMGRIFRALDECSLSRHTLVVFTTDHGIGFLRAKGTLYDPGLRTTLRMRWPEGFRGGRFLHEVASAVEAAYRAFAKRPADVAATVDQARSRMAQVRARVDALRRDPAQRRVKTAFAKLSRPPPAAAGGRHGHAKPAAKAPLSLRESICHPYFCGEAPWAWSCGTMAGT